MLGGIFEGDAVITGEFARRGLCCAAQELTEQGLPCCVSPLSMLRMNLGLLAVVIVKSFVNVQGKGVQVFEVAH